MMLAWKNVSVTLDGRRILDDVSLTARSSRVLGLVGANGAGKSTLMRVASSLVSPNAGSVELSGTNGGMARLGAIIEEPRFYPWADARLNMLVATYGQKALRDQIDAAIDSVGLQAADSRPVNTYSQGMRQRLGIARLLLRDPDVLLLDEPSNGLDPAGLAWLRQTIAHLRAAGKTIVISSHVLSDLERSCDDIAILVDGRVLAFGDVSEVLGDARDLEELYFRLVQ